MGPQGLPPVINLDDEESYDFDNQNNDQSQQIQNIAAQANLPDDSLQPNLPKNQAKVSEVDDEEDSDFDRSEGEQEEIEKIKVTLTKVSQPDVIDDPTAQIYSTQDLANYR